MPPPPRSPKITFVRDAIVVAVFEFSANQIANIKDAIGVAVGTAIREIALIRDTVVVAVATGSLIDITFVGDSVPVAVLAGPLNNVANIENVVGVAVGSARSKVAVVRHAIFVAVIVFQFRVVRSAIAVAIRQGLAVVRQPIAITVNFTRIRETVQVAIVLAGI